MDLNSSDSPTRNLQLVTRNPQLFFQTPNTVHSTLHYHSKLATRNPQLVTITSILPFYCQVANFNDNNSITHNP